MALKFSANISTMFTMVPLEDRFDKAKEFGFKSIEIQNPYDVDPDILRSKVQGLHCDLINSIGGASGCGSAAVPVHDNEYHESTQKAITYHRALNFKKLHILSGERVEKYSHDDQVLTLVRSLSGLVEEDFLQDMMVIGLIEPICKEVNDKYFLNSFETAIEIIKKVNNENIKLLLDVYHLHKITGNVRRYLEVYYPYAGHIQISQDPGRKEPFSPDGEIDYTYVLDFLRQHSHSDYIGLEYFPSDPSKKGFEWIKNWGQ